MSHSLNNGFCWFQCISLCGKSVERSTTCWQPTWEFDNCSWCKFTHTPVSSVNEKTFLGTKFCSGTDDYLYNLKRGLCVCLELITDQHQPVFLCVSVSVSVSVCNIPILEMVPKQNHIYTFKTMKPNGFNQFMMSCGLIPGVCAHSWGLRAAWIWTGSLPSSERLLTPSWARGKAPWPLRCSQTCSTGSQWVQNWEGDFRSAWDGSHLSNAAIWHISRFWVWISWMQPCSTSNLGSESISR